MFKEMRMTYLCEQFFFIFFHCRKLIEMFFYYYVLCDILVDNLSLPFSYNEPIPDKGYLLGNICFTLYVKIFRHLFAPFSRH